MMKCCLTVIILIYFFAIILIYNNSRVINLLHKTIKKTIPHFMACILFCPQKWHFVKSLLSLQGLFFVVVCFFYTAGYVGWFNMSMLSGLFNVKFCMGHSVRIKLTTQYEWSIRLTSLTITPYWGAYISVISKSNNYNRKWRKKWNNFLNKPF